MPQNNLPKSLKTQRHASKGLTILGICWLSINFPAFANRFIRSSTSLHQHKNYRHLLTAIFPPPLISPHDQDPDLYLQTIF
jgi:hypothetical protein